VRPPITLLDRLHQAGVLLLFAGLILWIGLALLRSIGKSSPTRHRHGKFVLTWMLGGWLIGAAVGVCIIDNDHYYPNEADAGMAGFGLLLGWVVGMIHGGVALAVSPTKQAEPGAAAAGGDM
jgi:prolipoprotein diacylglyceryltransferase